MRLAAVVAHVLTGLDERHVGLFPLWVLGQDLMYIERSETCSPLSILTNVGIERSLCSASSR